MKRILFSVTNDLVTDQRVHRAALALHRKNQEVVLIGRILKHSLPIKREYKTHRMHLLFKRGVLFYTEFNIRLFLYLCLQKADILVANDLDTLPANFLVSRLRRKKLVYDTHEYFTGAAELVSRPRVRWVWESMERVMFPKLSVIMTVNDSIADLYFGKYGKRLAVVRNLPVSVHKNYWPTRKELHLPEQVRLLIIQGSGININRGAEEAVQAMQYLENVVLLILGGGDVIPALKQMVNRLQLTDKVIFRPKMPYHEMINYTHCADIGLSLDKDTSINYRFSLPNKLFDYIHAGIPVLCSDLPEVSAIVKTYNTGDIVKSHDPEHIAYKIKCMLSDAEQLARWKINLERAARELCWESEEPKLMQVYETLLTD